MHPNTTNQTKTLVYGPMGWMGCVGCEKLQCNFVAQPFVLIAPVQYALHQVSCSYKRSQIHRNTMKQTETLVWGPPGWIGCVRREKSRRDFVSQTFVLTAPVQYVLHRVSCS